MVFGCFSGVFTVSWLTWWHSKRKNPWNWCSGIVWASCSRQVQCSPAAPCGPGGQFSAFIQSQEYVPEHRCVWLSSELQNSSPYQGGPSSFCASGRKQVFFSYDSPDLLQMPAPGGAERDLFLPHCWSVAAWLSPHSSCLHLAEGIPQRLSLLLKTTLGFLDILGFFSIVCMRSSGEVLLNNRLQHLVLIKRGLFIA